jgi:diaminohydroxyphosphoribosylaminopyrimidine deaminase/5-amino-6-(5-phosphoribosylamino)uracil reductase
MGGDDRSWMALALDVARRANPAPNPRVGAVIVCRQRLVSIGWHVRAGGDHAEIAAIRAARGGARAAVLYVTLEPCNHFGRTPPCVDAIVEAGIARVVVGCRDPNPHVAGGGLERLEELGVKVCLGLLGDEAVRLIDDWARGYLQTRSSIVDRPFEGNDQRGTCS